MLLNEIYNNDINEYKDLRSDTEHREAFDEIYPFIKNMISTGTSFTDAFLLAQSEFGFGIVSRLYMNVKERLQQAGITESEQINEDYSQYTTEQLLDMFNNAYTSGMAEAIRAELRKRNDCPQCYKEDVQFEDVTEDDLDEAMAWAKSGNKVVRKFRCSSGPRKGRVVSKPAQCFAPPDMKKRISLKRTKAKQGKKMARKAKKSKRTNPASKRVAALNKK